MWRPAPENLIMSEEQEPKREYKTPGAHMNGRAICGSRLNEYADATLNCFVCYLPAGHKGFHFASAACGPVLRIWADPVDSKG